ncbi:MAG: hypothetical protein AAGF95_30810 [Chloroflexota bacterium]
MSQTITCLSISVYREHLTRGKQYLLLDMDDHKRQVKIRADNQRVRWFPRGLFEIKGGVAPTLVTWQFDDAVEDSTHDAVEVSFVLSDGQRRWCWFMTPSYLQELLDKPQAEPGIWLANIVVVRDLSSDCVDTMLKQLDQQGELEFASMALQQPDDEY